MAVQAAVMNPHFIPFSFPGALTDYEIEKSYEDSGLLGEAECGEFKETTRDLLSFIDSASSNIKLALDKPVKSRRKVNHRKYLQKQIKRCTGMISPGQEGTSKGQPASPSGMGGFHCRPPPKRDQAQSSLQTKSLADLFDNNNEVRGEKSKKVPLRNRNLPPSFFTEPAQAAGGPGLDLRDTERYSAEAVELLELLGTDYSGVVSDQDVFQAASVRALPDLAALYEPHPLLGGLVYPDPWSPSSTSKRSPPGFVGLQPVYTSDPALSSPVEEHPPHLPPFSPFFGDGSLPPAPYDFTSCYSRAGYSAL